jgi:alkaline phosphatase D
MLSVLALSSLLATTALATPEIIERNLAYRSPYVSHPALAIDTHAVHKRHLAANAEIHSGLRKRADQVARPAGEPVEYPSYPPGYGVGVTKYTNAQYVYGGQLNYTHSVASGQFLFCVVIWILMIR